MTTFAPSAFSAESPHACTQDAGRHLKWIRGTITLACCALLVAAAGEAQGETVRVFPLDASQVAESASDSTSTGCAQATLNAEQTQVTFYIEHGVANPTGAFVGFAPQGNFGATQFTFASAVSPIQGTWEIPSGLVDEFLGNPAFLYVRIDSAARPNGDIRGQIVNSTCTFENGGGGEAEGEGEGEGEDVPNTLREIAEFLLENINAVAGMTLAEVNAFLEDRGIRPVTPAEFAQITDVNANLTLSSLNTFLGEGESEGEGEGEGEDPPAPDPCGGCQGLKDGERTVQDMFNAFWPFLVLLVGFSAWNRRRDRQP